MSLIHKTTLSSRTIKSVSIDKQYGYLLINYYYGTIGVYDYKKMKKLFLKEVSRTGITYLKMINQSLLIFQNHDSFKIIDISKPFITVYEPDYLYDNPNQSISIELSSNRQLLAINKRKTRVELRDLVNNTTKEIIFDNEEVKDIKKIKFAKNDTLLIGLGKHHIFVYDVVNHNIITFLLYSSLLGSWKTEIDDISYLETDDTLLLTYKCHDSGYNIRIVKFNHLNYSVVWDKNCFFVDSSSKCSLDTFVVDQYEKSGIGFWYYPSNYSDFNEMIKIVTQDNYISDSIYPEKRYQLFPNNVTKNRVYKIDDYLNFKIADVKEFQFYLTEEAPMVILLWGLKNIDIYIPYELKIILWKYLRLSVKN